MSKSRIQLFTQPLPQLLHTVLQNGQLLLVRLVLRLTHLLHQLGYFLRLRLVQVLVRGLQSLRQELPELVFLRLQGPVLVKDLDDVEVLFGVELVGNLERTHLVEQQLLEVLQQELRLLGRQDWRKPPVDDLDHKLEIGHQELPELLIYVLDVDVNVLGSGQLLRFFHSGFHYFNE